MNKRFLSRYSVCKKVNSRYKNIWGLQSKDYIRSVFFKRTNKITSFGEILNIKQSFKAFYSNLKESSFKNSVKLSIYSSCMTLDRLVSLMESRLDCVLYRSCLVTSFQESKQIINHGFVSVNGFLNKFSYKKIKKGDIIRLDTKFLNANNFLNILSSRGLSNNLELDFSSLTIIFLWDINFKNVYYPVNMIYLNIFKFYK